MEHVFISAPTLKKHQFYCIQRLGFDIHLVCLSLQVKFVGESVDDCGGGYSESVAEMCDELQANTGNVLNLLMATPNGRDEAGTSRDCYLFNPTLTSQHHLNNFRFLGMLMGMAIRSGSPLRSE